MITETKCSDHPDAPHGFVRNASHSVGHYVCECSGWTPPASIQEELRSVPERSRTTLEAADRIDLDATHIDTLAKVVDKLQTERDALRANNKELLDQRFALMEQVAELAKDAERYQWLRLYGYVDSMKKFPRTDPVQTDMFDLAIDAAMKEQI